MIHDVRFTASPAYEIHAICEKAGIPYAHITPKTRSRTRIGESSFLPNRMAYFSDVSSLEANWVGLVESQTHWSIIVYASEEEASEFSVPYSSEASIDWVLQSLMNERDLVDKMTRRVQKNANKTYLSSVLTELYKIQPKEERPFTDVFKYLSGVSKGFHSERLGLMAAVKSAKPIRRAIKELKKDRSIANIRKVAKEMHIDTFEINYTLAKGKLKELDDD